MVSNRCKIVVREELKKMGLHFVVVDFGEVEIMERLTGEQRDYLKNTLEDDQKIVFDARTGLMRGESSFLDWRKQTRR